MKSSIKNSRIWSIVSSNKIAEISLIDLAEYRVICSSLKID